MEQGPRPVRGAFFMKGTGATHRPPAPSPVQDLPGKEPTGSFPTLAAGHSSVGL